MMEVRNSLPGLVAAALGLSAGVLAFIVDSRTLGLVAGLGALAAGVLGLVLSRKIGELTETEHLLAEQIGAQQAQIASLNMGLSPSDSALPVDPFPPKPSNSAMGPPLADPETQLFSEEFLHVVLDSRIAAARRHLRPISVVVLQVVTGLPESADPVDPAGVAEVLRQALREADTTSRLNNGYFALLLEDTPENGAIWTVERVRRQLLERQPEVTTWAGVACYPAHAFNGAEILEAAHSALVSAREWRQDRIEVAAAAD